MTDTRRFWLKVTALVLPVLLPLALPLYVVWRSGELVTADAVADRILAGERDLRFSQGCTNQWRRFKLRIASSMTPNVLVLGGSSALEMRGDYFTQPSYNAAATVGSLWHATEFVRRLGPEHQPRVLMLGLHPYMLLEDWHPWSRKFGGDFDVARPTTVAIIQSCVPNVAKQLLNGNIRLASVFNYPPRSLGMQILLGAPGFRPDGSHDRGQVPPIPERFEPQLTDARRGVNYHPFGTDFGPSRMADFRELLDYCRAHGIHLVVYFPAIATPLYNLMAESNGRFDYLFHAYDRLSPLVTEYGFTLFDASDLRAIGATDREMLDGTHPTETADLRLLLRLVERDATLRGYVDVPRLQALLTTATDMSVLKD
jgi:hypothetical protein